MAQTCAQGAASSAAACMKGGPGAADVLLALHEELPGDCTEGADESDDGGARRCLRSHAAAAAAAAAGEHMQPSNLSRITFYVLTIACGPAGGHACK